MRAYFTFFLGLIFASPLGWGEAMSAEAYQAYADQNRIETVFYERFVEGEAPELKQVEPAPASAAASAKQNDYQRNRLITAVMVMALILGFGIFLFQNAGLLHVDVSAQKNPTHKKRTNTAQGMEPAALNERVKGFEKRPDRLQAVEDMLADALSKAERDLGLVFGEADTARELEQRLRGLWAYHAALRGLVQASEQSQFAGKPLDAQQYAHCLHAYRQIMSGAAL